jgi:hypothetical protein
VTHDETCELTEKLRTNYEANRAWLDELGITCRFTADLAKQQTVIEVFVKPKDPVEFVTLNPDIFGPKP